MATNYLDLAAQLRKQRTDEAAQRKLEFSQGGPTSPGGTIGGSGFGQGSPTPAQPGNANQPDWATAGLNMATKYNNVSNGGLNRMLGMGGTGGATGGAVNAAMPAMSAGGGSSLGSMGLMSSAPAVSFPGAASAGSGGAGAGGALGGAGAAAGGLAGLGALAYLGDKEMNESKGSFINADKLNNAGTLGGSGIGFRAGDLVNGFNPATWISDPKKAGKGLVNAFTFGLADKVFDLF